MTATVRHTGIVVADFDAALHFWCEVLGFVVQRRMEEAGPHINAVMELEDVKVTTAKLADPNGNLVELLKFHSHPDRSEWNGTPVTTGLTHIALTVDDLDGLYETLRGEGVRFHTPPQISPDGLAKFTYCRGPEGLILELVEVQQK